MKIHRFYVKEKISDNVLDIGSEIFLKDIDLHHQLKSVLRMEPGDKIVLFDGSGIDFLVQVASLKGRVKGDMVFHLISKQTVKPIAKHRLNLVFSLIKKDNIELVIEKCTELGVSKFTPIISERSEKKGFNMERVTKKIIEACEQSGRGDIPTITEPISLEDFISVVISNELSDRKSLIVFHTSGNKKLSEIKDTPVQKDINVCIGPEGGWSEKEIKIFTDAGAHIAKLDTPILRAETASIVGSALLLA